jgi:imidazoleglycerol-phosphate dehydratase
MIRLTRDTRETSIRLELDLEPGESCVATGDRFLAHMLETLARYAGVRLAIEARGDLRHHLVEDTAIALGEAFRRAAPEACARFGERTVPMDDALVQVVLDFGGRAWYRGPLPSRLYDHWMRSFATESRATLHLRVLRGADRHHVIEAAFKAVGLALGQALAARDATLSTKGAVERAIESVPAGTDGSPRPEPSARGRARTTPAAREQR